MGMSRMKAEWCLPRVSLSVNVCRDNLLCDVWKLRLPIKKPVANVLRPD